MILREDYYENNHKPPNPYLYINTISGWVKSLSNLIYCRNYLINVN